MYEPDAIAAPGGVGFDINCGVRLIRTNLVYNDDFKAIQEELTQTLFNHIPVGVGSKGMNNSNNADNSDNSANSANFDEGVIPTKAADLVDALEMGMDWSLRQGYSWAEDKVITLNNPDHSC